jgi:hypothetical protein
MSTSDEDILKLTTTYTWNDAVNDLALTTQLTVTEALSLTRPLLEARVNAYEAFPPLKRLVRATTGVSPTSLGQALAELMMLVVG